MQSMGSQVGGDCNKNNGTRSGNNNPTVGQNTVICLTLDDVQNQLGDLGKPLSSMNLDELLQNVWTVEVNQARPSDVEDAAQTSRAAVQPQANLPLAADLSNRTVDEVWRDIQGGNANDEDQDKLGEMTLEDFLVKAGVVIEASKKRNTAPTVAAAAVNPNMAVPQHVPWLYVQPQYLQTQQGIVGIYMTAPNMPQPLHMVGGAAVDVQNADGTSAMVGALPDSQRPWKKRGTPEDVMERTIERRQKRMIKNRESAARSRARKQAYTSELENKVSQLEEENEKLRKLKEIEKILAEAPPPERNCPIRRTFSA